MGPHRDAAVAVPLDRITTHWPLLDDPVQFVLRYAPAIRTYLTALLRDPHDADEVEQAFLARVVERGIAPTDPARRLPRR